MLFLDAKDIISGYSFSLKLKIIFLNSLDALWYSETCINAKILFPAFNDFNFSNVGLSLFLILAGPMTVIPLFLYVRGVELIGLGPTGMIFYITPTLQFILGYFYYNEPFSITKFVSFIIIWIAVIIYLKDLYEKN